jgi:hypothetical protein
MPSRYRPLWYWALGASLLVHALFLVSTSVSLKKMPRVTVHLEKVAALKPALSSKFVKRPPLRQQVLERQVARPRAGRALRRSVAAPQPFAQSFAPGSVQPSSSLPASSRPTSASLPARPTTPAVWGRGVPARGYVRSAPVVMPVEVAVTAPDQLDLGLELLDVEALDTGRYRALVVQDRQDKRNLKGFVHLAAVGIRSALLAAQTFPTGDPSSYAIMIDQDANLLLPDIRHSADVRALAELATEIDAQTGLKAVVDEDASLDSPAWMSSPFILLTALTEFETTTGEVENLGRYLVSGGLAYVEEVGFHSANDVRWCEYRELSSLRQLIRGALVSQGLYEGQDWGFERLAMSHPLFHCYYDMDSLPPSWWTVAAQIYSWNVDPNVQAMEDQRTTFPPLYLEGVQVKGRLVAIYSRHSYRDFWSRRLERTIDRGQTAATGSGRLTLNQVWLGDRHTGEAAMRLGINVVIYALTQEGSLAQRYVEVK